MKGPGFSGAWVVDALDGDVYGILFAGSASLNETYIIPFEDVLDNISKITKASNITLPTSNESWRTASLEEVENGGYWEDTVSPSTMLTKGPHDIARPLISKSNQFLPDFHTPNGVSDREISSDCANSNHFDYVSPPTGSHLVEPKAQSLTFWDVFCLIVNKIIGTGIFIAPSTVSSLVGRKSYALTVWIFGFFYTCIRYVPSRARTQASCR
jgi:hypothetical protein